MPAERPLKAAWLRSRFGFLALAAILAIAACTSHLRLPVDVVHGKLSPRYAVSFVNETGTPFDVLPVDGASAAVDGASAVRVPPGGRFTTPLQLRSFTVGPGSSVPGTQIVDSPYFDQAGADQAAVRIRQGDTRTMLFSLDHPSWFGGSPWPDAPPVGLVVPVKDWKFSLTPLFLQGPHRGP